MRPLLFEFQMRLPDQITTVEFLIGIPYKPYYPRTQFLSFPPCSSLSDPVITLRFIARVCFNCSHFPYIAEGDRDEADPVLREVLRRHLRVQVAIYFPSFSMWFYHPRLPKCCRRAASCLRTSGGRSECSRAGDGCTTRSTARSRTSCSSGARSTTSSSSRAPRLRPSLTPPNSFPSDGVRASDGKQ
ncbi:hypothetical protein ZIOFF_036402 [Zingiber officinale]|uniref:Uncharacterized protein n=1 Tax=Zingiber officinale TaxID=94328 RepID=A0A8J5GGD1_ZINOF|nr:hypothetical protein ZIOFF_036402 [Zingiber officinale]